MKNGKNLKKADIQFGKHDRLPEDAFDPKNVRERISIMIREDIVDWFRETAEKTGGKYQTLINEILIKYVEDQKSGHRIEDRVEKLEKAVFKRHG